jgi:fatty-acyl-CoA synthase
VIDPETGQDQSHGAPGELVFKGYNLMQGYYNKPEETAKAYDENGWFHTGDMAETREDGYVRFVGRYKDMLKIGGENVDPMEVEGYLLEHPGVHQVAVVGFPDERLTEVAVAFVQPVPNSGVKPQDLIDHCKGRFASFKIPRHVLFVEEFPMTASGKIQKVYLREQAVAQIKG